MQNKSKTRNRFAKLGLLTVAIMASNGSQACSAEPYVAAVCLMAVAGAQYNGGFDTYVPAYGQLMQVNQYQALYALIGATYGGNGQTNFALPNLQGRVVVGTGTNAATGTSYKVGAFKDNPASIQLTVAQLPPHVHPLSPSAAPIQVINGVISGNFSNATFNTSLAPVTAATTLANVKAIVNGSDLLLNGSSGGTLSQSPLKASLGTPATAAAKIYSDAAPSLLMLPGSISGTAQVTFMGTPTTTLNGNPVTTMTGSPTMTQAATSAVISGATGVAGTGQAINIMPSYLAMTYFISTGGVFPSPN
jgi:microcystin-dependent protein